MAPQLAWIGVGNMGRGMCKNLVEKAKLSDPLILYNRTTKHATDLSSKIGHSIVANSIEEAVSKADIIFICLSNDDAVITTIETALKGDVKGKLFVDASTIHPKSTTQITKAIEAQGGTFVAMPVFGATPMAESGQLICVLAGNGNEVEKVKPYCVGVMGRAIIDLSNEAPSQATALKVIGNTFILQMVEALGEGHTIAEKSGLGAANLHKFIELFFPGPYTAYSNRMLSGDYYNRDMPLFSASNARKDAGHALKLASDAGARMRAVEMIDDHLKTVEELKGGDKGDIAGIYGAVRVESGLKFENQ
ncbi:MAG: hypothetical protein M1834_000092 [Cirrosporium novae-zelandiae]|nr:MAG: hypothetical protein M1834_000092 [Cirrosporium novae-zelandiae]